MRWAAAVVAYALVIAGCSRQPITITLTPEQVTRYAQEEQRSLGWQAGYYLGILEACGADRARVQDGLVRAKSAASGPYAFVRSTAANDGYGIGRQNRADPSSCAVASREAGLPNPRETTMRAGPARTSAGRPNRPERSDARPSTPTSTGTYCPDSFLVGRETSSLNESLELLRTKCAPGDSIIIQRQQSGVIAAACDLARPVSPTGDDTVCIMGNIRRVRQ